MLQRAVDLDPEYALAYVRLTSQYSNLYERMGAQETDLEALDQASLTALDLAPEFADAHLARLTYYSLTDQHEAATRACDTALRLDPVAPMGSGSSSMRPSTGPPILLPDRSTPTTLPSSSETRAMLRWSSRVLSRRVIALATARRSPARMASR